MAITSAMNQYTVVYDPDRGYMSAEETQYRRMRQMQEDEHRRILAMQAMQDPRHLYGNAIPGASTPDPQDPLAFLKKADKNLLLTGETQ